ncbi:hypothetical protein PHSY_000596 [Pseudozyma hubeiensis SY62]|uniref:Uncharacterized protein n=1 Tax=Pseudozyma hubeiensis (strain SY62) TaxID=1305764 RepID=R9P4K3_PSEHS|nr:hypothetical protein PHSY_000596 [Pseudozyma hubeiensis SY62]GAC93035.1 hypothetical protein PHSY_000596 [Pseudozyma hubeiensis SY62]
MSLLARPTPKPKQSIRVVYADGSDDGGVDARDVVLVIDVMSKTETKGTCVLKVRVRVGRNADRNSGSGGLKAHSSNALVGKF